MGSVCSTNGKKRNAYRILVGNPEGKRSLGRTGSRLVDNIKMDAIQIGCGGMDWIPLVRGEGPVSGSCKHGNESSDPQNAGKSLCSCATDGFSRRAQRH
jgi:hypothetical protein